MVPADALVCVLLQRHVRLLLVPRSHLPSTFLFQLDDLDCTRQHFTCGDYWERQWTRIEPDPNLRLEFPRVRSEPTHFPLLRT